MFSRSFGDFETLTIRSPHRYRILCVFTSVRDFEFRTEEIPPKSTILKKQEAIGECLKETNFDSDLVPPYNLYLTESVSTPTTTCPSVLQYVFTFCNVNSEGRFPACYSWRGNGTTKENLDTINAYCGWKMANLLGNECSKCDTDDTIRCLRAKYVNY